MMLLRVLLRLLWAWIVGFPLLVMAIDVQLPTERDGLLTGEYEEYFMYVDRNFEGVVSRPWQGGTYGFCRTPRRLDSGALVYSRFHEGMDVSPLHRDGAGEPQDLIGAIAAGEVVHASPVSGHSNYGRYVVVAHEWDGCNYYSLYAHLADVRVQAGDRLEKGGVIGRMGYSGVGLNRRRAHLHLELCLMMSEDFQDWFELYFGSRNYHGVYNGMNLLGLNVQQFLVDALRQPEMTVPQFLRAREQAYWQVLVPAGAQELKLVQRYPWLRVEGERAASWRVTFSAIGLPLRVEPDEREVDEVTLVRVRPSEEDHRWATRGLLGGVGTSARISSNGVKFLRLVFGGG